MLIVLSIVGLAGCRKEMSADANRTINSDTLYVSPLKKEVSTYIPDNLENLVYEYQYDTSRKLISRYGLFRMRDPNGGVVKSEGTREYVRDAQGRVISIKEVGFPVYMTVEYENAANKVKKIYDNSGRMYIVYLFDAGGHLSKLNYYERFPTANDDFQLMGYNVYKYNSGGNLTERSFYNDPSGAGNLQLRYQAFFEHDNKFNPHYSNDYALYPEIWDAPSPNNIIRQINIYNGTDRDTINFSFTYDSLNRPLTSLRNADTETKYYYY